MQSVAVIDQSVIETIVSDIREIKLKLLDRSIIETNNQKEYYSISEASATTGLADVTIRKAIEKLINEDGALNTGIIKKHGKAIRIPYNTLHNIILK
jgi:Fic family protein